MMNCILKLLMFPAFQGYGFAEPTANPRAGSRRVVQMQ